MDKKLQLAAIVLVTAFMSCQNTDKQKEKVTISIIEADSCIDNAVFLACANNTLSVEKDDAQSSDLKIDITENQTFFTSGGRLYDMFGNDFIIRGNNNPHIWYGNDTAINALDPIAACGSNLVRIVWETKGDTAKMLGTANELRYIIKLVTDKKMVAMPELHDFTGHDSLGDMHIAANYWTSDSINPIMNEFKNVLLINIANEWTSWGKDSIWLEGYKLAINKIRAAGMQHCLVIDAGGWGQDATPIKKYAKQLLNLDPLHNLLFDVHMYMAWNDEQKIIDELQYMIDNQIPIIVGEFGYDYNEGCNNLECRVNDSVVVSTCNRLGIGFMPWSWSGNNAANAWLDIVKDWGNFTDWGQRVIMGNGGIKQTAKPCSVFSEQSSTNSNAQKTFCTKGGIKSITINSKLYNKFELVNTDGTTQFDDCGNGKFAIDTKNIAVGNYQIVGYKGNTKANIFNIEIN